MGGSLGRLRGLAGDAWRSAQSPLYRNAFLIIFSTIVGQGLGFFFWLLTARFYTPSDVGYAVALVQTLGLIATFANLGLGIGLIRFLPGTDEKTNLVNSSVTLAGGMTLILSAAFLVIVNVAVPDLSFIQGNPIYPAVILVTTLAIVLPSVYDQVSFAVRRADVLLWRTLILAVAKIPLVAGFAFLPLTRGRLGVFMALSIAYVVSTLIEVVYLVPRVLPGYRPRPQLEFGSVRPMLRFSLGNYSAGSISAAGGLLLPILILDILGPAGADSVAYFYIASLVAGLLGIIPGATFTSFYAEASQRNANRQPDELRAILLSAGLLVPGVAALWIFSEQVLTWFGNPAYASGSLGALRILIFGSIPGFLNTILLTRLRLRKKSAPLIVASAISTAVTLVLGILFLWTNGINGLALASVVGAAASTPYYYLVARRSSKDEPTPPVEPSVMV